MQAVYCTSQKVHRSTILNVLVYHAMCCLLITALMLYNLRTALHRILNLIYQVAKLPLIPLNCLQ